MQQLDLNRAAIIHLICGLKSECVVRNWWDSSGIDGQYSATVVSSIDLYRMKALGRIILPVIAGRFFLKRSTPLSPGPCCTFNAAYIPEKPGDQSNIHDKKIEAVTC